jgi:hypothetical protein
MEFGIFVVAGAFAAVVLMVNEVDGEEGHTPMSLPDYEPVYESLAINVADYQMA